jgi:hypothetical protein
MQSFLQCFEGPEFGEEPVAEATETKEKQVNSRWLETDCLNPCFSVVEKTHQTEQGGQQTGVFIVCCKNC